MSELAVSTPIRPTVTGSLLRKDTATRLCYDAGFSDSALKGVVSVPMPSVSTVTESPGLRNFWRPEPVPVDRDDQFLMGVQAVVVPGKGVAACQAGVDWTHK